MLDRADKAITDFARSLPDLDQEFAGPYVGLDRPLPPVVSNQNFAGPMTC